MMLLSAEGTDVPGVARDAFSSDDHVRDVIHNFNTDGFDSLKKVSKTKPTKYARPLSTWSLSKLADATATSRTSSNAASSTARTQPEAPPALRNPSADTG